MCPLKNTHILDSVQSQHKSHTLSVIVLSQLLIERIDLQNGNFIVF